MLVLGESSRPFVMAQRLRDSCRKWVLAEGSNVEHIIDRVVLEQFITHLPRKMAEWVQCYRLTSLDCHPNGGGSDGGLPRGRGTPFSSLSLSLSLSLHLCFIPLPPPLSLDLFLFPGPVHQVLLESRLHWPAFSELLGCLCADASWGKETQGRGVIVQFREAE